MPARRPPLGDPLAAAISPSRRHLCQKASEHHPTRFLNDILPFAPRRYIPRGVRCFITQSRGQDRSLAACECPGDCSTEQVRLMGNSTGGGFPRGVHGVSLRRSLPRLRPPGTTPLRGESAPCGELFRLSSLRRVWPRRLHLPSVKCCTATARRITLARCRKLGSVTCVRVGADFFAATRVKVTPRTALDLAPMQARPRRNGELLCAIYWLARKSMSCGRLRRHRQPSGSARSGAGVRNARTVILPRFRHFGRAISTRRFCFPAHRESSTPALPVSFAAGSRLATSAELVRRGIVGPKLEQPAIVVDPASALSRYRNCRGTTACPRASWRPPIPLVPAKKARERACRPDSSDSATYLAPLRC